MDLHGKSVLLTGGSDGIGLQLALQLKDKGAHVVATGRTPERIAVAQSLGIAVIQADLSSKAGVDALLAELGDHRIDILINNAGMGSDHDFREGAPDLADNDRCIWLNLNAPIHLTARLLDRLKARPEAMIVNVTSGLAIAPRAGGPVYCATKAGLRSYTQAVRAQLKGTNVHVMEALPPVVDTKMTAGRGGGKMTPKACAAQIIAAMERNAKQCNVGMVKLLNVLNSMSPALARAIMIRF